MSTVVKWRFLACGMSPRVVSQLEIEAKERERTDEERKKEDHINISQSAFQHLNHQKRCGVSRGFWAT
ncbi:ENTH domain-containing protein C19F8.03c [Fusarium oxysporum f. sp. albedinis]|nr:ENTH domain-containing protein C19F8.03c [Fusarium oxysporum f. sp. albedinis]